MKVYSLLLFDSNDESAYYYLRSSKHSRRGRIYYAVLRGSFEISHGLCISNHVLIYQGLFVSFFFTEIELNRLPFVFQSCSRWTVSRHLFIILLSDQ